MLVGWRSASVDSGGLSVTIIGIAVMLKLCAGSWDTIQMQVCRVGVYQMGMNPRQNGHPVLGHSNK